MYITLTAIKRENENRYETKMSKVLSFEKGKRKFSEEKKKV